MISIANFELLSATGPGGTPVLRVIDKDGEMEDLHRQDVEELRDVLEAWLRGEVLR